jgi:predicted DNA-binding transcriptional regulator AlpA
MATASTQALPRREAAAYLGYKAKTLANWASLGKGPKYIGRGRSLRYPIRELDRWITQNTH